MKGIGSILVLMVVSQADAQLFRRACRSCAPRAVKVVQQQVIQQQVVPVVPVAFVLAQPQQYGVPNYTPPAPVQQETAARSSETDRAVRDLASVVNQLLTRMEALEGKIGAQKPTDENGIPQIVQQQCAKCHTAGDAKGEFALELLWDVRKNRNAVAQVKAGKMPVDADGNPVQLETSIRQRLAAALEEMVK